MSKMTIKVSLNSNNPDEAELIRILKDKSNRSGHLKLAAMHYWNVTGLAKPSGEIDSLNNVEVSEIQGVNNNDNPRSILDETNAFATTF